MVSNIWSVLNQAVDEWFSDRAPQLGAALAFYSAFSLVPLLAMLIALFSQFVGTDLAEREFLRTAQMFLGEKVTVSIGEVLRASNQSSTSLTVLGVVVLLFSASGVFGELQSSMNVIWDVEESPSSGIFDFIRRRVFSMLMVLGTAFLLLVSLAATTLISITQNFLWGDLNGPALLLANTLISLTIVSSVFALIIKYIPDIQITWKDVWPGAIVTGILFEIGKSGIGWYLGRPGVGESFGAAASIIMVLMWVYYSAQILFFGSELTQVYTKRFGSLGPQSTELRMSS